jgi:hypothetical protein
MNLTIINDLHCGVERRGGTTPASANALREWTHAEHRRLLKMAGNSHVIVVGDLTDAFDIPLHDALEIYSAASDYLGERPGASLTWVKGNHDVSKDSSKMGTVEFVGWLLRAKYGNRFSLVSRPAFVDEGVYAIPHLVNQEAFDAALAAVPDGTKYLLLHCNFDNPFAGQQDHSLNIERSVVRGLKERGITTIIAHEHQGRTAFAEKLIVVGNQFPTSVADCLGTSDTLPVKRMLRISAAGVESVTTWKPTGGCGYCEVDWQNLEMIPEANLIERASFIRVAGEASAEQAADVVRVISDLRQRSKAFVITNAVKIAQVGGMDALADSVEDMRKVDVIELLIETLSPEQQAAVRKLRAPKRVDEVELEAENV